MIYLDNAATSRFKPQSVYNALFYDIKHSANSGRSGHDDAISASIKIENCRQYLLSCFGAGNGNVDTDSRYENVGNRFGDANNSYSGAVGKYSDINNKNEASVGRYENVDGGHSGAVGKYADINKKNECKKSGCNNANKNAHTANNEYTNEYNLVFTKNCSEALNLAIQGGIPRGSRVVTTANEHNSVLRPLFELQRQNVLQLSVVTQELDGTISTKKLDDAFQHADYAVINLVSNVTGARLDPETIGRLARKHNVKLILDASQAVPLTEINMQKFGIDMMACPGHKGLHGIQGTGFLIFKNSCDGYEIGGHSNDDGISSCNKDKNGNDDGANYGGIGNNNNATSGSSNSNDNGNIYKDKNGSILQGNGKNIYNNDDANFINSDRVHINTKNNGNGNGNGNGNVNGNGNGKNILRLKPLLYGGTGTASSSTYQPTEAPEAYEAGTQFSGGIAALMSGAKWSFDNLEKSRATTKNLASETIYFLKSIGACVYCADPQAGVVSFNLGDTDSSFVAEKLNDFGIAVRSGLHCAPLVHKFLGTENQGAVRVSVGVDNTENDILKFSYAVEKILMQLK